MIRYLKTLGLAMIAALALSAALAGSAVADETTEGPGQFTITDGLYPTHLTGFDRHDGGVSNAFTGGFGVVCEEVNYTGQLGGASSTLDLAPNYLNCMAGELPATITPEGCEYRLHVDDGTHTTEGPTHWSVDTELVCPTENPVTIHVYGNAAHTFPVCTIEVPAQGGLASNVQATDETENGLLVRGAIAGIRNSAEGLCVEGGETQELPEATLDVNIEVGATGGTNPLHIG